MAAAIHAAGQPIPSGFIIQLCPAVIFRRDAACLSAQSSRTVYLVQTAHNDSGNWLSVVSRPWSNSAEPEDRQSPSSKLFLLVKKDRQDLKHLLLSQ